MEHIRKVGAALMVTAGPGFHPLREITPLTAQISELGFQGEVLFDLLAVNGLEGNRFASMSFSQGAFDRSSFSAGPLVDPMLIEEQDVAARTDPSFLSATVLSSCEVARFEL